MVQNNNKLDKVKLFAGLSPKARASLEARCKWIKYRAEETIIEYLDDSRDVFFLIEGHARVQIYSNTGKVVAFREIVEGDIFGEYAAIDRKVRSASVEATRTSLVASMSSDLFWEMLQAEPTFMRALIRHMASQIRSLTTRIYEFSTLAVNNRIHCELLRLVAPNNIEGNTARIAPVPKHSQIASSVSTTREAVAREMSRLARIQLVVRRGPGLIITDVERLRDMIHMATGE